MGLLIKAKCLCERHRIATSLTAATLLLLFFSACNSDLLLESIERDVEQATAPQVPELVLKKDNTVIIHNDHYEFGHREVFNTASEQFSIKNDGNTELQLTGSELVGIESTGTTPPDIFAALQPSSPIPAGGTVNFFINFTPQSLDSYTGEVHIESNDPSLPVLEFTISGIGTDDISKPEIVSRSPAPLEADHLITDPIRIEFNEPLEPSSIDENSFAVTDVTGGGSIPVSGSRDFEAATNEAVFTPSGGFTIGHEYHVELSSGIIDLSSNTLLPDDWYFTAKQQDSSTTGIHATLSGLDLDSGEVTVYLLVYDQNGTPLEDFSKYNFYVEEDIGSGFTHVGYDGLDVQSFVHSGAPKSLSVIMDNSGSVSMSGFQTEKNVHTDFFNSSSFAASDAASLWKIYPPIPGSLVQDFTTDSGTLITAMEAIPVTGSSYIFELIYHAISHHAGTETAGLDAVILSYDGANPNSYNADTVNSISNETNIPIYPLEFYPSSDPATLEHLGTAGWSYNSTIDLAHVGPSSSPAYQDYLNALYDAVNHMARAHAITWTSTGNSGDSVNVKITINYSGENGSWSREDTDEYTLP